MALQDNALVTLAEAKVGLKLTGATSDAAVETLINAVSDRIEGLTGRRLKTRTYANLRLDGPGRHLLTEVDWPITAISACVLDETTQTVWFPGDAGEPDDKDVYVVDGRDPKTTRWALYRWSRWSLGVANIKLSYTAGYGAATPAGSPPIPEDLKAAAIMLFRHWWYLQDRQAQGVQSRSIGAESVTYLTAPVPSEAKPILTAYTRWVS